MNEVAPVGRRLGDLLRTNLIRVECLCLHSPPRVASRQERSEEVGKGGGEMGGTGGDSSPRPTP